MSGGEPSKASEALLLKQYLRAAGWNLSEVARQLSVSRMTLYRRMARWGIQTPNHSEADKGKPVLPPAR